MDSTILDKELPQTTQPTGQAVPAVQSPVSVGSDEEQIGQITGQIGQIIQSPPAGAPARKEQAPISVTASIEKPQAIAQPTRSEITTVPQEIKIPEALKDIGIEQGTDRELKLSPDVKKAGVALSKDSTPVPTVPSGAVTLPMQYTQAVVIQKNKKIKIKDAMKWLAAKIAFFWRREDPVLYK